MALTINPIRFIKERNLNMKDLLLAMWFTVVASFAALGIIIAFGTDFRGSGFFFFLIPAIITTFLFILFFGRHLLERRSFWLAVIYGVVTPFVSSFASSLLVYVFMIPVVFNDYPRSSMSAAYQYRSIASLAFGWIYLGPLLFLFSCWITVPLGILGSVIANRFAPVRDQSDVVNDT